MLKKLYKAGYIVYFALLLMAIIFYKERTIFLDIAYHLFSILKNDGFAIQAYRFGAVVTQIFPVIGSKLSLSLETITIMYSAGVMLYYIICYWICGTLLKQYELALGLLFVNILFVTRTFYWMQAELPQGIAFMFILFALLKSTKFASKDTLKLILLIPVTITAVCFHPALWIPAFFIAVYYILSQEHIADKRVFIGGFLLFLGLFYIKTKMFVNEYDSMAMNNRHQLLQLLPKWFTIKSTRLFFSSCMSDFIWIPICSLIITIALILKRKWLQLLLVWGFLISYTVLINTSYSVENIQLFYIENLYLPLAIALSLPMLYDVFPMLQNTKRVYIISSLIAITGLIRIYNTHTYYTDRISWLSNFINAHKNQKLIITERPEHVDKLILTWGTPYEFWLLSTIETGKTESLIISGNPDEAKWACAETKVLITTWGVFPYNDLPKKYFKFYDTTSGYRIIE